MQLALLDFHIETAAQPLFISADRNSLQRLLTILLDNAVRYTPPGGMVCLQVAHEGDRAVFAVRDTGICIAPEHQTKIFDRFYRVDRTRGSSQGSGLGLALAKWIAEKHGSSIFLESAVLKGSTFWFSIATMAECSGLFERTLVLPNGTHSKSSTWSLDINRS